MIKKNHYLSTIYRVLRGSNTITAFDNQLHKKLGKNRYYRRNIDDILVEERYFDDSVGSLSVKQLLPNHVLLSIYH